ncbi:O-antigen ligase family protein [Janibacter sp. G368]|uniref:O-antigen ligase family protein n=1 Tax=Janibacter sp. G368 TaxID=3420441 RepID=UPI003CFD60C8
MCFATVLGTQSRTGLLSTAGGILWLCFIRGGRLQRVVSLTVLSLSIIALNPIFGGLPHLDVLDRFQAEGTDPNGVLNGRAEGWSYARNVWEGSPIIGVGYRAGASAFEAQRASSSSSFTFDGAHSSYWQLLLELGLVGAAIGGVIACVVLRASVEHRSSSKITGLAAIFVSCLMLGVSESALVGTGQVVSWIFWMSAAGVVTLASAERAHSSDGIPSVPRHGPHLQRSAVHTENLRRAD